MTRQEEAALCKAIDVLCDDFRGSQSLSMAFTVCSSICKALIEMMETSEQQDRTRRLICKNYIGQLRKDIENYKVQEND